MTDDSTPTSETEETQIPEEDEEAQKKRIDELKTALAQSQEQDALKDAQIKYFEQRVVSLRKAYNDLQEWVTAQTNAPQDHKKSKKTSKKGKKS